MLTHSGELGHGPGRRPQKDSDLSVGHPTLLARDLRERFAAVPAILPLQCLARFAESRADGGERGIERHMGEPLLT